MSTENLDNLEEKDFISDPANEEAFIENDNDLVDNEFDSSEFNSTENFKVKSIEEYVDENKGEIIDRDSLSPWDKIKHLARQLNVEIKDPNSDCKKCFGRGYTSIDTDSKTPIPCECIFFKKVNPADMSSSTLMKHNRKSRRNLDKLMALQRRIMLKQEEKKKQKSSPTKAFIKKQNRKKMKERTRKINRGKK